MCNTFAVYFQIFATFGYKKVKNSENDGAEAPLAGQMTLPDGLNPPRIENLEATTIFRQPSRYCNVRNFKSDF